MEAKGRKPQFTHKGTSMGPLVLIRGTFAKAFNTFAKLFFCVAGLHQQPITLASCIDCIWLRGPMDEASAYGAGDCESCRGLFACCHCRQACGPKSMSSVLPPRPKVAVVARNASRRHTKRAARPQRLAPTYNQTCYSGG